MIKILFWWNWENEKNVDPEAAFVSHVDSFHRHLEQMSF